MKNRFQEKLAAPTITHHIYLDRIGATVYLDISHAYPRFQNQTCEDCIIIERRGEKWIQVKGLPDQEPIKIESGKFAPVAKSGEILVSPAYYEGDKKMRIFVHDLSQAELDDKRKRTFFPYQADLSIMTEFSWLPQPQSVVIQRSDGSSKKMQKVAELKGKLEGKEISLSIYNFSEGAGYKQDKASMLLFRDFSNGKKTYGAGRFLNVEFPQKLGQLKQGDKVPVNFNYAYNPPCAVSTGFHCPLPQDTVSVTVEAGEAYTKL